MSVFWLGGVYVLALRMLVFYNRLPVYGCVSCRRLRQDAALHINY
jgi:hypothetical protein